MRAVGAAVLGVLLAVSVVGCRRDALPAPPAGASATGSGGGVAAAPGTAVRQIRIGGRQRAYRLHVPSGLPAKAPLVLMLHGGFGTGEQAEQWYGWDARADAAHF